MTPVQADAICRLREECYRIARWTDPEEPDFLAEQGILTSAEPRVGDLRVILGRVCHRWLAWDAPAVMGDDAAEFSAAVRALEDDARRLLRWIEETEARS